MNPSGLPSLLILAGLALLVVAYIALRRPFLRRLAVRDATRRPSEAMLVIAGSLLGTALITGSFIVGDTLDSSIRASATTQLGPVDEVVATADSEQAASVAHSIAGIDDDRIDGVLSMTSSSATIATTGDEPVAEPEAQLVEVDFEDARAFGGDPQATGISGPTPGDGEVAIAQDLADTLEVTEGDQVAGYLYGEEIELEVTSILPRLGVAGYWRGFEQTSPNAFVAPGTFESILARGGLGRTARQTRGLGQIAGPPGQLPTEAAPPQTSILISNRGGVEDGVDLTGAVSALVDEELGTTGGLRVEPVKKDLLDEAEVQGDEFSQLFIAIGSFAIVAGVLLLVNIFVMLAEERKSQLGMLRAVGMRRMDLVRSFIIEGGLYASVASIIGAVLGIGVGWAIVSLAAPIFSGAGDFGLTLRFAAEPPSIIGGLCIGFLIALLTVVFTSVRISRINIIAAIRDLQETKLAKARKRTVIGGILVAALGGALFSLGLSSAAAWFAAIVGVPLIVFGLMPLLGRIIGRRPASLIAAGVSLAWGIFGNTLLDGRFYENGDIFAFVVSGVLLVFSAVILLSQSHETFGSTLHRIAAKRLPLRLGLAYPLARKFRTGLTLGMYSLVIFTMVFLSSMSSSFNGQVVNFTEKERGGFDLIVNASGSNPPTTKRLESVDGVDSVAPLFPGEALFQPPGYPEPEGWFLAGASQAFVDGGPPALEERAEEFKTNTAVWDELMNNPNSIIISNFFLQTGGGPPANIIEVGDTMAVINPVTGEETERRVIGVLASDSTFAGSFVSEESARELLGDRAVASRFYIDATGSEGQARELGRTLQGEFLANGVEADTFGALVDEQFNIQLQFFNLMQAYLALGLIVGIAGLGVVMVRSVRDRRREVGVLRSLGFQSPKVRVAFLLESGFVAIEGIVVGTALAIVTASRLVNNGDFGEGITYEVPWTNIALLTGAALVASLIATAWPAQQASRIAPAVALRTAE